MYLVNLRSGWKLWWYSLIPGHTAHERINSMSQLILPKAWQRPEKEITPENVFNNRRHFLKLMGFATAGIAGALAAPPAFAKGMEAKLIQWMIGDHQTAGLPPIANLKRNPDYSIRRPMTKENAALKYNNFYEFPAPVVGSSYTDAFHDMWHQRSVEAVLFLHQSTDIGPVTVGCTPY